MFALHSGVFVLILFNYFKLYCNFLHLRVIYSLHDQWLQLLSAISV